MTKATPATPLIKLGNYLQEHERGIDTCWTGKVIEEARQEYDAVLRQNEELRSALAGLRAIIEPLTVIDDNVCYLNGRYAAGVDVALAEAERVLDRK